MKRRQFLKSSTAGGAGLLVLKTGSLAGPTAPSNKLNIAMIGTWGRAHAHFGTVSKENVVALCDVDEKHLESAAKKFPGAKTYVDWRDCLEQKDLDAVVCATTDHTHAFIASWALNRDLHIYCEKPLANSVEEARVVRAKYLAKKDKLATQVGTQRHANENFDRVRELVKDGAIGTLKDVHAWGNRQLRRDAYPKGEGIPPEYLHYDLWIGPSPWHPYNKEYFSRGPGANCLSWNMFWDFGSGQIGDMGSHTMDLAWNALDADLPTTAEGTGDPFNPDVTPVKLMSKFDIPANDWRPEIRLMWHQGGAMPKSPMKALDLNKIGHGVMFKGDKGFIVADFGMRLLIPYGKGSNMTYYKPRSEEDLNPPIGHFQEQWIRACKGENDRKTACNFDYGSKLIETMLLGLVAYRVGKKIEYDGDAGKTNDSEANKLLARTYREGWVLDG